MNTTGGIDYLHTTASSAQYHSLASVSMPDTNGFVVRARDNLLAIGRKCNGQDSICVSFKGPRDHLASLSIPDTNGAVPGARDNLFAIGRKCNRQDSRCVSFEGLRDHLA